MENLWDVFNNANADDDDERNISHQKQGSKEIVSKNYSNSSIHDNEHKANERDAGRLDGTHKTSSKLDAKNSSLRKGPEIVKDRPEDIAAVPRLDMQGVQNNEKNKARPFATHNPGAYAFNPSGEKYCKKGMKKRPEIVPDRPEDLITVVRPDVENLPSKEKSKESSYTKEKSFVSVSSANDTIFYSAQSFEKSVVTPYTSANTFEEKCFKNEYTSEGDTKEENVLIGQERQTETNFLILIKNICRCPGKDRKKLRVFCLLVLFLIILTLAVVLGTQIKAPGGVSKSISPVDPNPMNSMEKSEVSINMYNLKGLNAAAFSEDEKARALVGQVLAECLQSDIGKGIFVHKVSFMNATEIFSGTSFSYLTYEIFVNPSSSANDQPAIQAGVDWKASSGELTNIAQKIDTSEEFGFWFAASTRAIYDVAITIEHKCNSTTNIESEENVNDALEKTHEYFNDKGGQGLQKMSVLNVQITSGDCKNSEVPTQISKLVYILVAAECTGICPEQGIPEINSINRRRLVEPFKDNITSPALDELKKSFDDFTNIEVLFAQTDFDKNGLIGCNDPKKCNHFSKFWRVVRTFESDKNAGFSLDLSGDGKHLVLGDKDNDQVQIFKAKSIYRENHTWDSFGQIPDPSNKLDNLGYDVSISENGNTVAIGAYRHDNSRGIVKIYNRVTFNSTYQEWLTKGQDIVGDNINDCLGILVDLANNANSILVGASQCKVQESRVGYARVYDFEDDLWILRGNRTLHGKSNFSRFGEKGSITEDGKNICISGYEADYVSCYFWENLSQKWQLRGSIIEGDEGARFGSSIALSKQSGNTLVIGSFIEVDPSLGSSDGDNHVIGIVGNKTVKFPTDDNLNIDSSLGTAHIYEFNGAEWKRNYTTSYGRYLGYSVDLSKDGSIVAVCGDEYGAPVQVFRRTDDTWMKMGQDLLGGHQTSVSLSTSGKFIAIGLPYLNKFGRTTVYEWIP